MAIRVNLDVMLAKRKMSVGEFAERICITPANVSVLKNGRAKAIRFSTLDQICKTLNCQPGDILEYVDDCENGGDVAGTGNGVMHGAVSGSSEVS